MQSKRTAKWSLQARIEGTEKGRAYVVLPLDPEGVWGLSARYHVRGTMARLCFKPTDLLRADI
jgi:hypothetical protein